MKKPDDCRAWQDAILADVLGELEAGREAQLREHLKLCAACRDVRDALAAEERELRETFAVIARRGAEQQLDLRGPVRPHAQEYRTVEARSATRRFMMRAHWVIPAAVAAVI